MKLPYLSLISLASATASDLCSVADSSKVDCGYAGINQSGCESKGCCWVEGQANSDTPWCFYQDSSSSGYTSTPMTETATGYESYLTLSGEPLSQFGSVVRDLKFEAIFEADDYVRVRITDASKQRWEVPQSLVKRPSATAKAATPKYSISYTESPFTFEVLRSSDGASLFKSDKNFLFYDQYIQLTTSIDSRAKTFGLGESARLNMGLTAGSTYTLWARDEPALVKDVNLYGSFPFYTQMLDGKAHGVMLFNSNGMDIQLESETITFKPIGGIVDLYVFAGSTPNQVEQQYTSVVGRPAMMPYWAFGFHNCKYGYTSVGEVEDVVANYRAANIPLDTQWMDIDYMEAYKDFTVDPTNFPLKEVSKFVNQLHDNGMKFVPIIDPGIFVEVGYPAYDEGVKADLFVKDLSGGYYLGQVWPGPTFFPDFFHPAAQQYWTDMIGDFYDQVAVDGLWIDMNEVSNFCNDNGAGQVCTNSAPNGCPAPGASQTDCCLVCSTVDESNSLDFPPYSINNVGGALSVKTMAMSAYHSDGTRNISVYDAHNLYGLSEQIATAQALVEARGKRPFLLTRSSFPSSGLHTAKWTGDNGAYWEDLKASIVGIMDFSLFGVPMVGADICGFIDNSNEELCTRWIEVGAFYPFSRDHSALNTINQELYVWESTATAARSALAMRYQIIPYLYTLFFEAHTKGDLVTRALWANFPSDPNTLNIDYQFMLGEALLISPVVDQGATSVSAYFPKHLWYNFQTLSLEVDASAGGLYRTLDTPLTSTNVHVKGYSILALQEPALTTTAGRLTPFSLVVALCSEGGAEGSLFWDDGEQISLDQYLSVNFAASVKGASGMIKNDVLVNSFSGASSVALETIVVMGKDLSAPGSVSLNGLPLSAAQVSFDATKGSVTFSNLGLKISDDLVLAWGESV